MKSNVLHFPYDTELSPFGRLDSYLDCWYLIEKSIRPTKGIKIHLFNEHWTLSRPTKNQQQETSFWNDTTRLERKRKKGKLIGFGWGLLCFCSEFLR